jgi:hypothetical protein
MNIVRLVLLGSLIVAANAVAGRCDDAEDDPGLRRLTVRPAAEPTPTLKFRLFPASSDRHPGNAAQRYMRIAIDLAPTISEIKEFSPGELLELPVDKLPLETLRVEIAKRRVSLEDLDKAARCQSCDWDMPTGPRSWTGPWLNELQECRRFAYWLALAARLQILDGKYDDAVHTLETGFALGKHVSEAPGLIAALTGIGICNVMLDVATELIQRTDSPNLYWALTCLPQPFVDIRKVTDDEMGFLLAMFPILHDVESSRTPEQWNIAARKQFDSLQEWGLLGSSRLPSPWALSAKVLELYPTAKRRLIAGGRPAASVESMPVLQVVLIDNRQVFVEYRDALQHWMLVPYWQGHGKVVEAEKRRAGELEQGFLPLSEVMPWFGGGWMAVARTDRKIAALRVIEAIRLHAAAHQGQPPRQLSDIDEVPVPPDPATGRPFEYAVAKKQVVLTASPLSEDSHDAMRYEVQF